MSAAMEMTNQGAQEHRVSAHTLTSNSVDSVATALAGCRGRLLIAAHSEGGASVVIRTMIAEFWAAFSKDSSNDRANRWR